MKKVTPHNSDFFHDPLLYSDSMSEEDSAWSGLSDDLGNSMSFFLSGERKEPDAAGLLALAREISRLLSNFFPPDDFQPAPIFEPDALSEAMIRDIGARSLKEYYGLIFKNPKPSTRSKVSAMFPRGPESLRPAVSSLAREKSRLLRILNKFNAAYAKGDNAYEVKIRHIERRLETVNSIKASLLRAARLWPSFKDEALNWPHHARLLLKKARRLEKDVDFLTQNDIGGDNSSQARRVGRGRDSLLHASHDLKQSVSAVSQLNRKRDSWKQRIGDLLDDIDNLLAVAIEGREQKRDWVALGHDLSERLSALDQEGRLIVREKENFLKKMVTCLNNLTRQESMRGAATAEEAQNRAESLSKACRALLDEIMAARKDAARLYFILPSRIGQPVYLDKMFLNTALALGRSQAVSEDLKHRLELFSGRFSSSGKIKQEADDLISALQSSLWCDQTAVKVAGRRLNTFRLTVQRNAALSAVKDKFTQSSEKHDDLKRQMRKSREENQQLVRDITAAGLEKERLIDQLGQARLELNELSLTRSRLIKIFQRKKDLFDDLNKLRLRLQNENASLKEEQTSLKEREARLLDLYNRDKSELRKALEELETGKYKLSELDARRRELETEKIEVSRLRKELASAQRKIDSDNAVLSQLHRDFEAKSAELDAARHELELDRVKNSKLRTELEAKNAELSDSRKDLDHTRNELANAKKHAAENKLAADVEKSKSAQLALDLMSSQKELYSSRELLALRIKDMQELEERLKQHEHELESIHLERRSLNTEINTLNSRLTSADTRLVALKAEVSMYRNELASANEARRVLEEKTSALGRRTEQMAQAHQSLLKTLRRRNALIKQGEAEKEIFQGRVDKQKATIIRLISVRQKLRAEMGAAHLRFLDLEKERDELQNALQAAKDMAAEYGHDNAKITDELQTLKATVSNDLGPLIQLLGAALWQSEAQLQKEKDKSSKTADDIKLQFDVRFANMRIQSAAREADMIENTQAERRRLEMKIFEQQESIDQSAKKIQQISLAEETWRAERDRLDASNRELTQTVAQMDAKAKQLRDAITTLKKRYEDQLLEAKKREGLFEETIRKKDEDLELQREKIIQLEPLVEHFIAAAAKGGNSSLSQALHSENKAIIAELLGGEAVTAAMMPQDQLNGAQEAQDVQQRLQEAEPMVAFLAKSFMNATSDLAQATADRNELAEKLRQNRQQTEMEIQRLEAEIKRLHQESELTQPQLKAAGEEIHKLRSEVETALSTRAILENSLAARESELMEVREQAFRLTGEKEAMKNDLEARAAEIITLKKELAEADRDLEENDGRLEAAWAALNYLGTKAGDAVAKMKKRLEAQTRELDELSLDLKKRDDQIKGLEELQDKLAILYWTVISKTVGDNTANLPLPLLPEPEATMDEDSGSNADSSGFGLGRQIIESAKKVARRSLFTLILTGGLIMGSKVGAVAAPSFDESFHSGRIQTEEPALQSLSRMHSSYLGRQVSLSFLTFEERSKSKGDAEQILAHKVENIAAQWEISPGELLKLIRTAKNPDESVELLDFSGRSGAFKLLDVHMPQIVKLLKNRGSAFVPPSRISGLMKAAAEFKPYEGLFWERVFFDFLAVNNEVDEAFEGLLSHLSRKNLRQQWPRHEFAGCLSPFNEIENMGPQHFIEFMSKHIKSAWMTKLSPKGRERLTAEVAGDIYFSARAFKLPLTLVAALAHQELALGNDHEFSSRPAIEIYSISASLVPLINRSATLWHDGRPPLCDLDEALVSYAAKRGFTTDDLYQKKLALVMAYNKHMSHDNLFKPMDDDII